MASPRVHGHVSKMDTIDAQKAQAGQYEYTGPVKRNELRNRYTYIFTKPKHQSRDPHIHKTLAATTTTTVCQENCFLFTGPIYSYCP